MLNRKLVSLTAVLAWSLSSFGSPRAEADIVHADDVIISKGAAFGTGLCVGGDCASGEDLATGSDWLRVKFDNLRLHFEDTSSGGGFPNNDWRIVINDTNSGGADYFAIEDAGSDSSGTTQVFRIDATAPANSLRIDDSGDIGIGTATPAAPLHIQRSNGTAKLLVEEVSGALASRTVLELRNNGNPRIDLVDSNSGVTWRYESVGGGGSFRFFRVGSPIALGVGAVGNVTVAGTLTTGGTLVTGGGGTCDPGPCDAMFQPDFQVERIEEHAAFMWEHSYLQGVGPTKEGFPLDVNRKIGGLINELEKAHIYIERLHERLGEEQARNDELENRLARLEAMLTPQTGDD